MLWAVFAMGIAGPVVKRVLQRFGDRLLSRHAYAACVGRNGRRRYLSRAVVAGQPAVAFRGNHANGKQSGQLPGFFVDRYRDLRAFRRRAGGRTDCPIGARAAAVRLRRAFAQKFVPAGAQTTCCDWAGRCFSSSRFCSCRPASYSGRSAAYWQSSSPNRRSECK